MGSHLSFPITDFYSESIYSIAAAEAEAAAREAGSWGDTKSATVIAGVLTLDGSGFYEVDGANASNNVDTINGLDSGDEVILAMADVSHALIFRHGVDNLNFLGGVNISLGALVERVRFMFNGTDVVEASSRP